MFQETLKNYKNLISLFGLCCVTKTWTIKSGDILKNKNVGIYNVKDILTSIEVRDKMGIDLVKKIKF